MASISPWCITAGTSCPASAPSSTRDAVEVLLTETLHHEGEEAARLQHWGGLDWETRRNHLAYIAFEMHEKGSDSLLESDLSN